MNSKDVISIIETICDKLGIAADSFQDFIPELIKYRISFSVFYVIVSILVISVSLFVIKYAIKRAREIHKKRYCTNMDFDDYTDFPSVVISSLIGGTLSIIFFFVLLASLRRIVVCIVSPQAYAIDYILGYFK